MRGNQGVRAEENAGSNAVERLCASRGPRPGANALRRLSLEAVLGFRK